MVLLLMGVETEVETLLVALEAKKKKQKTHTNSLWLDILERCIVAPSAAEMDNEKSSHCSQTPSLVHFFADIYLQPTTGFPTHHVAMKRPLGSLPGRWLLHRGFSHAH